MKTQTQQWRFDESTRQIRSSGHGMIADLSSGSRTMRAMDNYRLMSAAPALLHALTHALAALEHGHPEAGDGYTESIDDGPALDIDLRMIREAIAKAEGAR